MVIDLVEDINTSDVNHEIQSPSWDITTNKRSQNTKYMESLFGA